MSEIVGDLSLIKNVHVYHLSEAVNKTVKLIIFLHSTYPYVSDKLHPFIIWSNLNAKQGDEKVKIN